MPTCENAKKQTFQYSSTGALAHPASQKKHGKAQPKNKQFQIVTPAFEKEVVLSDLHPTLDPVVGPRLITASHFFNSSASCLAVGHLHNHEFFLCVLIVFVLRTSTVIHPTTLRRNTANEHNKRDIVVQRTHMNLGECHKRIQQTRIVPT